MTACCDCLQDFNVAERCQSCQAKFWQTDRVKKLKQRVKDLEALCTCYRTRSRPSDKLLDHLVESEFI